MSLIVFQTWWSLRLEPSPQAVLQVILPHHRHARLSSISLTGHTYFPWATNYFLTTIERAASDGIFPSLREVRVREYKAEIDPIQISRFTRLGIALEFTCRYQNRFLQFVPFLLCPFFMLTSDAVRIDDNLSMISTVFSS